MLPGYTVLSAGACDPAVAGSVVDPLYRVGCWLRDTGYRFITVTPLTHARVLGRACRRTADSLADIFGWNLPFHPRSLPSAVVSALEQAHALIRLDNGLLRSNIRFSTLGDSLYLHSGYPTVAADAVFFGPDTYRFVALIERTLPLLRNAGIRCIADIGCGTGAGGIAATKLQNNRLSRLVLTDINPMALQYAAVNVALAQIRSVSLLSGDLFSPVTEPLDLILANPPYLLDSNERIYRHGGGNLGSGLSLRIVQEGLARLAPGGTLILYTASPIVDGGRDIFREALSPTLEHADLHCEYREIDPDVFGEELERNDYRRVERIAVISLVIQKANSDHATRSCPAIAAGTT
jgi:methylase of polypeptide subunit release factors